MTPVRTAAPSDRAAVANVLDGAALAVDHDDLADRLLVGDVFLFEADGPVLGALVLEPPTEGATGAGGTTSTEGASGIDGTPDIEETPDSEENRGGGHPRRIAAIAVRRSRRGQGIGVALVEAAADEVGSLVAEFDADLRPFYDALGFAIYPLGGGRFQGRLEAQVDAPE